MSILDREMGRTPIAVVDVESTGLSSRHDRIVELAIVVIRPGEEPQVVFDSLIKPDRSVAATEIHGITEADVVDAPTFASVAPAIVAALANRVICSHNVYFDVSFLRAELERSGYPLDVPHLCSMLLPRVVDRSTPHLSLANACQRWGVVHGGAHAAVHDATAAAKLVREHVRVLRKRSVHTFGDLRRAAVGDYQFLSSFDLALLPAPPAILRSRALRPRGAKPATGRKPHIAAYLEALVDAAADLRLDEEELTELIALPARLGLASDEVRAVHAKVFWGMLGRFVEDCRIDRAEAAHLGTMQALLRRLGWAPGDEVVLAPSVAAQ